MILLATTIVIRARELYRVIRLNIALSFIFDKDVSETVIRGGSTNSWVGGGSGQTFFEVQGPRKSLWEVSY